MTNDLELAAIIRAAIIATLCDRAATSQINNWDAVVREASQRARASTVDTHDMLNAMWDRGEVYHTRRGWMWDRAGAAALAAVGAA